MNFTIDIQTVEGMPVLYLQGEVDAFTAPKLQEKLIPLVSDVEIVKVTVDLSNVSYMDSTGIGTFIGALKAAQKSGCQLYIQNPTSRVQRLFAITGLQQIIQMIPGKGADV